MVAENSKRVLVVDDDPELLHLVRVLLARLGAEVMVAHSASQAAQVLKTPPLPDLLILDLMLPEVSGLEFLKQIRAKSSFDALPVLVMSAMIDPDQIRKALEAGADRYLTKPYIANNLLSVAGEILRTGRRSGTT
ncbi:MAG: response regulator [bacterium]|nr:response regulator [bacterium]